VRLDGDCERTTLHLPVGWRRRTKLPGLEILDDSVTVVY